MAPDAQHIRQIQNEASTSGPESGGKLRTASGSLARSRDLRTLSQPLAGRAANEQHLTRTSLSGYPGYPDSAERSRTLERGRQGRGPAVAQPQGISKAEHPAKPSQPESLKIPDPKPDPNAKEEVSLEDLIKKYNGPRSTDRFAAKTREATVTVETTHKNVTETSQRSAEASQRNVTEASHRNVAKQGNRIRSMSCQRPPTGNDPAAEVTSSATAATSGKFSSMRELLKNVVSSQKNVQQQKMEFAQKNGKQGGYSL